MSEAGSDVRIAAALAPLPAGGADPAEFRDTPAYEALDAEMRKLEREGPTAVAWPQIVRDGLAALQTGGKDITVACWLTLALASTESLPGLCTGLAIVDGVVERWWDSATPARPRARAGALDWLATRTAPLVPAELGDGQAEAALAAYAAADALESALAEKLPANPVALGDLLRPLRALASTARAQLAAAQAASAEATAPPPVAVPAPPAPAAVAPGLAAIATDRPEQAYTALHDTVRTAALALMEANPAEWRSYQLLRSITWLGVTELPPAQAGRTALMPPPGTRLSEFDSLAKANNQLDLLLAVERFCSASGLFWLDGQRISALALAALGPRYAPCAREVASGTLALLDRLPGLETLMFNDGTPFASGATRAWIETIRPQPGGGPAEPVDAAPWIAGFAAARQAAMGGDAEAALAGLSGAADATQDGRSRAFWRLAQARLCLEIDLPTVALALLRELDSEIDRHGLETWERNLSADIAALLYQCAASSSIAEMIADGGNEAARAFARAARSNPVLAAKLLRTVPT